VKVSKAVITAAGPGQQQIPLQTLINRHGQPCSTLSVQLSELAHSGIREVAIVVRPEANEELLRSAAGETDLSLRFIRQDPEAKGFGHAILSAADFTGGEAFLLMVGDHIYLSEDREKTCAAQLIEIASQEQCLVSAVQPTHESQLNQFGTIGGILSGDGSDLFEVAHVREKPTPTYAEQHLLIPGQRLGYYLCFFGMHVITPEVMTLLREEADELGGEKALGLSNALDRSAKLGKYLGIRLQGARFNLEQPYGQLKAQIAIGLQSRDRDQLLSDMIELLAPIRSRSSEA
jgi:UTP--glucose-1-phosphate uridylyltransferase